MTAWWGLAGLHRPWSECWTAHDAGSITSARYSFPGVGILTPTEAPTIGGSKQKFYSYNYGAPATRCCAPLRQAPDLWVPSYVNKEPVAAPCCLPGCRHVMPTNSGSDCRSHLSTFVASRADTVSSGYSLQATQRGGIPSMPVTPCHDGLQMCCAWPGQNGEVSCAWGIHCHQKGCKEEQ